MTGAAIASIDQAPAASDNRSLFRSVLQTLLRGAWVLGVCLLLFAGAVAAYLFLTDKVYEAETTVIIDTDRSGKGILDLAGITAFSDVLVELEVLRSLDLAKRVSQRLMLDGPMLPYPIYELVPDSIRSDVTLAQAIQEQLTVDQVRREVGVVRISVRSTSPREAQHIARLYAEEYTLRNLELSRAEAAGLRVFLESQMEARSLDLVSAESALQGYQEKEKAIALDQGVEQLTRQMADLQSLADQARVELEVTEAELRSLQGEVDQIQPNLYDRVASGLDNEIAMLQTTIARREADNVEAKYARTPSLRGNESADPELAREIRELAALRLEVDRRARVYVDQVLASGGVDAQVASRLGQGSGVPGALANVSRLRRQITEKNIQASGLRARLSVVNGRLSRYQRDFNRIPAQSRQIAAFERERQSSEQTYAWLQQRYEEARVAEESEFGYVRVLDEAVIPKEPVAPRPLYSLVLAVLLGGIVGLTIIFGRELTDDRVRLPDDIRRTGVPVIGVVPDLRRLVRESTRRRGRHGPRPELIAWHLPKSSAAEAFTRVATGLEISARGRPVQTILVTSCNVADGKSLVAANVAVSMARSDQRTLLIDLNAWNPSAHRLLQTPVVPGITNVVFEGRSVREAVHPTEQANLYVMPLGDIDSTGGGLIGSADLVALLGYLRRSFQRIVIDAPPLLESGRAVALSGPADAVLLVVRAATSASSDLREALVLLEQANAPAVSAVLNGFNARSALGYFADRSYYGRYGSKSDRHLPAGAGDVRMRPAPPRSAVSRAPAEARLFGPASTG